MKEDIAIPQGPIYIYKSNDPNQTPFKAYSAGSTIGANAITYLAAVFYNEFKNAPYLNRVPPELSGQTSLDKLGDDEERDFERHLARIPKIMARMRVTAGTDDVPWATIADLLETEEE